MAEESGTGKRGNPGGKGTGFHAQWITTVLKCKHTLEFPATHMPEPGEMLWCKHCREYMECALIEEYRARCLNCTYSRRYGTAELTAKTKGTVHALKNMHTVVITKGDDEVDRISPKVTQEIFGDSPIPY